MNIYDLSRKFWDFAFENPDKIKPNHGAMYFFAIEHCNRLGWKERFGFPTVMAMEAVGIKSYNTFINTLKELVEFGFIEMIEKSKNQYSANIIALSNFNEAHNKALDKAMIKHTSKQSESTIQSIDSIDIPIYNITNTPINNNTLFPEEEIIPQENPEQNSDQVNPETGKVKRKKVAQKKERKFFSKADFKKKLLELGVDESDANDWIEVRRQKRAVFTENAIQGIIDECEKYNFSFPDAIKASANYGWQGFEYDWYLNKQKNNNGQTNNNSTNNGYSNHTGKSISKGNAVGKGGKVSASSILARQARAQYSGNGESGTVTVETEVVE